MSDDPHDVHRAVPLDYASPTTQRRWTMRMLLPPVVIGLLAAAYAVACAPAYWQRSWPPLDRLSQGWSWVWVPAAGIYLLLAPRSALTVLWLLVLAIITSTIHSCTYSFVTMNPVSAWNWSMWAANMILSVPFHVIGTAIVASVCWGLVAMFDVEPLLFSDHRRLRGRLTATMFLVVCVLAAPLIAHGYAIINDHSDTKAGVAVADADWGKHKPVLWSAPFPLDKTYNESYIACFVDPDVNVPIRQSWHLRFEPGYNAEIRRLLAQGRPAWLANIPRIDDQDMIQIQHSKEMSIITAYPYALSANAVVTRGSTTLPWGGSFNSDPNTAMVETSKGNVDQLMLDYLDATKPVWVGQLSKYPRVHFIRGGDTVIACSDDGWILEILNAQ